MKSYWPRTAVTSVFLSVVFSSGFLIDFLQIDFFQIFPNQAPRVNPGSDQTVVFPTANLNGTVTDDGFPTGLLVTTWTEVSGPGTVSFKNSQSAKTTATFSTVGTFVLRLSASDGILSSSDDVTIVVIRVPPPTPPVAAFSYSPANPVAGSAVSFDGSSSACSVSPCSYGWTDDADGSQLGAGVTMSFTFQEAGTKHVRLTVTDAQSQTGSVEHDVVVSAPPPPGPVAAYTYSPASPVVGSAVSFDGSSSTCSASPCSYRWTDDVDGSVLGTGAAISYTFQQAGTKKVRLTMTDAQSRSASVEHDVVVSAAQGVVFGYTVRGAAVGTTMSNTVSATRYQMASQNGTVTSMSVFIASPVSAGLITNSRLRSTPTRTACRARSLRPAGHKPSSRMHGIPYRSALRLRQTPTTGSAITQTVLPKMQTTSDMMPQEPPRRGLARSPLAPGPLTLNQ